MSNFLDPDQDWGCDQDQCSVISDLDLNGLQSLSEVAASKERVIYSYILYYLIEI